MKSSSFILGLVATAAIGGVMVGATGYRALGVPRTLATKSERVVDQVAPNHLNADQARQRLAAERDPFWRQAQYEVDRHQSELFWPLDSDTVTRRAPSVFVHGRRDSDEIALTFDDGPHPGYTERLLDILRREHVPATFFVVGSKAEQNPDLVQEMIRDGHEVGNHTYHHLSLPKLNEVFVADEIKACGRVLSAITGRPPHLFRPPGGQTSAEINRIAASLGYTTVLWTSDPGDYASPGESTILERTWDTTRPGGVLLLHDGIEQTLDVLPEMIESLRKEGFRFVTVDELMRSRRAPAKSSNSI